MHFVPRLGHRFYIYNSLPPKPQGCQALCRHQELGLFVPPAHCLAWHCLVTTVECSCPWQNLRLLLLKANLAAGCSLSSEKVLILWKELSCWSISSAGTWARKHKKFPFLWKFDLGKLVSLILLREVCSSIRDSSEMIYLNSEFSPASQTPNWLLSNLFRNVSKGKNKKGNKSQPSWAAGM